MYKSGGYNVYPREVEAALEDHPAVRAAAIVSVPDPVWQEIGWGFVLASPETSAADIMKHARGRLANYKLPKRLVIRSDLPMLPIGKIDKRALKERAVAGEYD